MPRPKSPQTPAAVLLMSADAIEQQFYEAMRHADLEKLMAVWADDDDITCVHPGGPRAVGALAIRATFESIFSHGVINAQPQKIKRIANPTSAIHSILERIEMMTPEGPQVAWVIATNVYLNTAQGWRLVAHHASPGSMKELPELNEAPAVLH
jgi:ketosteroid isomerase-like protein